ncbi:MAG: hypothetical protein WBB73_17130 [Candidatus Aminicenantaceae bacterium]
MWKSKDVLMKTVSDKLFPAVKELEIQGVFKQFDIVLTWNQDAEEPLIGFLDAGMIMNMLSEAEDSDLDEV